MAQVTEIVVSNSGGEIARQEIPHTANGDFLNLFQMAMDDSELRDLLRILSTEDVITFEERWTEDLA